MRLSEHLPSPELTRAEFRSSLDRALRRDPGALDALAKRYYEGVRETVHRQLAIDLRVSRPWLASRFSTGDIVQEVFDSVLEDLGAFRGETEDAFCGYLAMVVRNRIIDAIRHHQANCRDGRLGADLSVAQVTPDADDSADPAEVAERAESAELVRAALDELETRTQLLVRARLEGTASFAELTDQLGFSSESTTRRVFFDAHAKLAIRLTELGAGGGSAKS